MPAGSKVDRIYQSLLAEGHSQASAAKIAQHVSGQALSTGRPPKGTKKGEGKKK